MDTLLDILFIGFGAAGALLFNKVCLKKTSKKSSEEEGIYKFQPITDWRCPKCNLNWESKSGHKYCECPEYYEGHFHKECSGTFRNVKDAGCKFKWIMKTK